MSDFAAAFRAVRSRKVLATARSRRLLGALVVVAAVFGLARPAAASPILVSSSSGGFGPLTFGGDTISLTGGSTILVLDDTVETTRAINTAVFTADYSTFLSGTQNLVLSSTLTLAGVTHTVTQTATWNITPTLDTFVAIEASLPVLFETAAGSWFVTLNAFSFAANSPGTQTTSVTADFAPAAIPEPASLLLFGTGAAGLLASMRRRRQQQLH